MLPDMLPCFFAFDILARNGTDLRYLPLVDRKQELRRSIQRSPLQYAKHVHATGASLFEQVCKLDLEGVVAMHATDPHTPEPKHTRWLKIRNKEYSQWVGREELFERDRSNESIAGWHRCALAADLAI